MPYTPQSISKIWHKRRGQAQDRLRRASRVRDVLSGRFDLRFRDLVSEDEEPVVGNLIYAAARTLSQRVGKPPKLAALTKMGASDTAQAKAERHEAALQERLDLMGFHALLPQAAYWLICHGLLPILLRPDTSRQAITIDIRDPMTCFPDTVYPNRPDIIDCMFVSDMEPHQVDALWDTGNYFAKKREEDNYQTVKIAEFHTGEGTYISAVEPEAVPLDFIPPVVEDSPCVWLARDFSPDLDFYGQFDQVVPVLVAQAKLMALVMAYAEQQVFSETFVIGDVISNDGDWAYGPRAVNFIQPAPSASVGKVTNNMSVQVFSELDRLERAIRASGGFPAQLSGEPNASIATGRGLEQLVSAVDDNVGHYQNILSYALKEVFNTLPKYERAYGIYTPGLSTDVQVIPKFRSGTDPANSVRLQQLSASKAISKNTLMEQVPEVDNPQEEQAQIEIEALREALVGNVLAQAQQGALNGAMVAELIRQRKKGVMVEDAFQKLEESQAQAAPPAIPGQTPPALPPGPGQQKPPLDALIGMSTSGQPIAGVTGRIPIG